MCAAFLGDDFDEINSRFFREIRENKSYMADPSGWLNTILNGQSLLPPFVLSTEEIHRYQSDEDHNLTRFKEPLVRCVSLWDSYEYAYDNITICHSVTIGSMIVLGALKKLGIKRIIFETPVYFASVTQAEALGFEAEFIPTCFDEGFQWRDFEGLHHSEGSRYALWVSQPRMALGIDQQTEWIDQLLSRMPSESFLVIDEATEQHWPSHLNNVSLIHSNLIKIRSLTKGLGLNGLRCAYISHSDSLRPLMVDSVDTFQGGLDYESLVVLGQIVQDQSLFKNLLHASRAQVQNLRRRAECEAIPDRMILSKMENGYIGSVAMRRPTFLDPKKSFRECLLRHCADQRCPIILGSSMRFAVDPNFEFVRLNYYNETYHIIRGLQILREFYEA